MKWLMKIPIFLFVFENLIFKICTVTNVTSVLLTCWDCYFPNVTWLTLLYARYTYIWSMYAVPKICFIYHSFCLLLSLFKYLHTIYRVTRNKTENSTSERRREKKRRRNKERPNWTFNNVNYFSEFRKIVCAVHHRWNSIQIRIRRRRLVLWLLLLLLLLSLYCIKHFHRFQRIQFRPL